MTGGWTVGEYNTLSTGSAVVQYDVTQRRGIVRIQQAGTTAFARFGAIDVATGAFETGVPTPAILCPGLRIGYRGVVSGDAFTGTADMATQHGILCGVLPDVFLLSGARGCTEGAACDDGDPCTAGDVCTGGACVGTSACGACERCGDAGCVANVRLDCEQAAGTRSSLLGRNLAPTSSGPPQLTWKWKGGDGVALGDLGDPTAVTDYQLCVFDDSGAAPAVLFGAAAPAAACGVEPCWKAQSTRGFQFRNRTGAGDGLTSVVLKTGAAGKASVVVKGKGDGLTDRPLGVPAPPFALPLRIQLQAAGGACFEARIDAAGTSRNGDGQFKGKTTAP